jgi:hypothetical protein
MNHISSKKVREFIPLAHLNENYYIMYINLLYSHYSPLIAALFRAALGCLLTELAWTNELPVWTQSTDGNPWKQPNDQIRVPKTGRKSPVTLMSWVPLSEVG